jgi:hypothetical protein
MVVFEELIVVAVDAGLVAFFDESLLSAGGVSASVGGVDGITSRVMDDGADE